VRCAGVNGELHVCGITSDGNLWHTIRFAQNWQPFGDVKGAVGNPGNLIDMDCASAAGELHVCAVTS
jgi:hypothetical protein